MSNPSFMVVGRGRVGTTIASLLPSFGYTEVTEAPELLFITTPDSAIAETAKRCAKTLKPQIALHCSGAYGSELLAPLAQAGAATASLHPLRSFNAPVSDLAELRGVYWCIEGHRRAVTVARRIVSCLQGCAFTVRRGSKPLYHAAAVTACGHLIALVDMSVEMLSECGIGRRQALEVLLPLINSTVKNLNSSGIEQALTGPFARRDYQTIAAHLGALIEARGDYTGIYTALGRRSRAIEERNG